jgi:multidrug efflux pump subunit AcrB
MSLGGISLAIGMISDNAVVVLDALSSRFSGSQERPGPDEMADATGSALAGTFGSMTTTVVVFVPVFFLPGAIGGLFGDLAIAIIAANVAGWLAAVLALPALYRVFWSRRSRRAGKGLETAYRRMLAYGLRRPHVVLGMAAITAMGGAVLVAGRPVSFMPPDAANELLLVAEFPAGTDPDGMARAAPALSAALAAVPGVTGAYGSAGAEDDDLARRADPGYARESLSIRCALAEKADVEQVRADLEEAARAILPGGVGVSVCVPPDPAATLLGLDRGSVMAARGESVEAAGLKADEVSTAIELHAGDALSSIRRSPSGKKSRVILRPRREDQAMLGLSLADTAAMVRMATEGAEVAMMELDGREMAVRVFAAGAGLADGGGSVQEASSVPVSASSGAAVHASTVARFERTDDWTALARLDRYDVVYLEAIPKTGRERGLSLALERVLEDSGGVRRADESAFRLYGRAMAGAVVLVLVLLYLALGAQFESFTLPVAIMATIPLAMAGAGPALVLGGIGLDSGSVMGLIVLFGVVVNNAILLHETSSARRLSGSSPAVAAYAGASERVRPVLATSLTTVLALLPVCLSPGGAAQRSMSVAMLGGLAASTALTLFVSPVLFARSGARP